MAGNEVEDQSGVMQSEERVEEMVDTVEAPPPVSAPPNRLKRSNDLITGGPSGGRTGGVYIPPFKLAMMKKAMGAADKSSQENQKLSWEALRKSINGLINKVNVSNIKHIIPELFQENLVRGRGLFARAIMKAQLASPGFTHIYTALLAIVNTKLPENGELVLKRVIYGFKRAYKRCHRTFDITHQPFGAYVFIKCCRPLIWLICCLFIRLSSHFYELVHEVPVRWFQYNYFIPFQYL